MEMYRIKNKKFFYKLFLYVALSTIFLAFLGFYKLTDIYFKNQILEERNKLTSISDLIKINLTEKINTCLQTYSNCADQSKGLNIISKKTPFLKEAFLINKDGKIEFHSDPAYWGKPINKIYPDFSKNYYQKVDMEGVMRFKVIEDKSLNDDIMYRFLYKYFLTDDVLHPFYAQYTFGLNSINMKRLFLLYETNLKMFANWTSIVIGLFLILYLSYMISVLMEKFLFKRDYLIKQDSPEFFGQDDSPMQSDSHQDKVPEKNKKIEEKNSLEDIPEAIPID